MAVFLDGSPPGRTPAATLLFTPATRPPDTIGFEISPSPLTVAVEQGTATFLCQCSIANLISWRVNGVSLNMAANLSNISTHSIHGGIYTLSIGNLLVNNGISIKCVAVFFDGSLLQFTAPVLLIVQGNLLA